ncbi:MAG: GNAT family N-acetyltransferase [Betaproteobacteria bacterium]|nr:GNAT family N-acetyltransferase [Betaproteobacteria bacterium]
MINSLADIRILSARTEILPFIEDAIVTADGHKDALGFFPAKAFQEYAHRESVLIAVDVSEADTKYAGHLLFDCRFPKAHVLQMLASPAYRRIGIAKKLLNRLKEILTRQNFISIHARVAEDLWDANQFWGNQGFYIQTVAKGGVTRSRTILVRSHELATPQLFLGSGMDLSNPLCLNFQPPEARPLFLLDLNVLFDLGPRRTRNEEAINLFKAERSGLCSLAISTELLEELKRTSTTNGRTDPMLDFARVLPAFALACDEVSKPLLDGLASLIFPDRLVTGTLTHNDKSDLRHLATVIQHQLSGLVTSDDAILNAATAIAQNYGAQVLSLLAFRSSQNVRSDEELFEMATRQTLTLNVIKDADIDVARRLLSQRSITASAIANEWALSASDGGAMLRYGAWIDQQLVGYITWPTWAQSGAIIARVVVDESFPQSRTVAAVMLRKLLEQGSSKVLQASIELLPGQSSLREVAWSLGFCGAAQNSRLFKIVFRRIVTPSTWALRRNELLEATCIKLPEQPPFFRSVDQHIMLTTPDGNRSYVSIESLETLLAPAIFCLPRRAAVITPIWRDFANPLLGHSSQGSLLPYSKVASHSERHYFSDPKTLKYFQRGTIIFFYESGKRGGAAAVVAVARVRRSYCKTVDEIDSLDLDPSVLDVSTLQSIGASKRKTITTFDNVITLFAPVPMRELQKMGCGSPNSLISTRPITDEQMTAIIDAGFPHG